MLDSNESQIIGFIVNPIAGMGGSVGLKGTDGAHILAEALRRGAQPIAPGRAIRALGALNKNIPRIAVITCPGEMGEKEAVAAGIEHRLLHIRFAKNSTSDDTRAAAKELENQAKLILFAGGDGTARDIAEAVDTRVAVLGIPCGVKNYSGVFASSPEAAGQAAALFLQGTIGTVDSEVIDFDEQSMRKDRIETRIRGILRVPSSRNFMQNPKSTVATPEEEDERESIAEFILEELEPEFQYVLGPGSATAKIASLLRVEKTLLGVDVFFDDKIVAKDVTGRALEEIAHLRPTKLIVAPIGGQGYIFGRGNQQITPTVIRTVGKENVMVVCTRTKLLNLPDRRLLVDTGDKALDNELLGYWRIVVGYREFAVVKVQ